MQKEILYLPDLTFTKVTRLVYEYRELIKTERKVIAYRIAASTAMRMNETENEGLYVGTKPGISGQIKEFKQAFNMEYYSLGVSYAIYKEVNDGKPKYYRIKKDGKTGGEQHLSDENIIAYTPEREAFFKSIYKGMDNLLLLMSNFFTGDMEAITKKIEKRMRDKFTGSQNKGHV